MYNVSNGWATVRWHANRVECAPTVPRLRYTDHHQRTVRSRHRSRWFRQGGTLFADVLPPSRLELPASLDQKEIDHRYSHLSHRWENRRTVGASAECLSHGQPGFAA